MSDDEIGEDRHDADRAPGDNRAGDEAFSEGYLNYSVGFALAVLLTGLSFFIAKTSLVWAPSIPVAICVLAVAQMGVHLVFFLHITSSADSTNNILALAFGVLIVVLLIGGSLFIMDHLNTNMPPMDKVMQMQR